MADGLFARPGRGGPADRGYAKFTGDTTGFAEVAAAAKREVGHGRPRRRGTPAGPAAGPTADPALPAWTTATWAPCSTELLTAFGVYRAYVVPGEPPPAASASS